MKRLIILLLFSFTINLCLGQTQLEVNQKAGKDFQKADNELNVICREILKVYRSDTLFIKNLKTAQRIWLQFRDAEIKARYPDRPEGYYGSVEPLCVSLYMTELTQERTAKLKIWITGIKEGDSCAGTVRVKN
ncbi:MAG: lysozyme inhibitor LprI family protein [Ferruginibacter sp.]